MSFALVAWFSTILDVLIVAALLLRPWSLRAARREGRSIAITVPIGIVALLAFCPLAFAKLTVLALLHANIFGFMRLGYYDGVVAMPAVALIVLLAGKRGWKVSRPVQVLAGAALLAAPLGIYASFIEPFRLQLETATVPLPADRAGSEPITVGILADIQTDHVDNHELAAVDLLMQHKPDLILIPGDLWQGRRHNGLPTEANELRAMFARMSAPGGVYFVRGNLEIRWNPRDLFVGTPVQMLADEVVQLHIKDRFVTLVGMDERPSLDRPRLLQKLEDTADATDIRLVIGHVPDNVFDLLPNSRADLIVAGHTHGGQIVLPFFGPLVTFSKVPRPVAAGGLHEMDGRHIYVSRGVGYERGHAPRLRVLCPPEVSLLSLTNADMK